MQAFKTGGGQICVPVEDQLNREEQKPSSENSDNSSGYRIDPYGSPDRERVIESPTVIVCRAKIFKGEISERRCVSNAKSTNINNIMPGLRTCSIKVNLQNCMIANYRDPSTQESDADSRLSPAAISDQWRLCMKARCSPDQINPQLVIDVVNSCDDGSKNKCITDINPAVDPRGPENTFIYESENCFEMNISPDGYPKAPLTMCASVSPGNKFWQGVKYAGFTPKSGLNRDELSKPFAAVHEIPHNILDVSPSFHVSQPSATKIEDIARLAKQNPPYWSSFTLENQDQFAEVVLDSAHNLDPLYAGNHVVGSIVRDFLNTPSLVAYDAELNKSNSSHNQLLMARSIRIFDQGRRFEITLGDNWKWSTGEPITAFDLAAAFLIKSDRRVASPDRQCAFVGRDPIRFKLVDKRKFVLTFPSTIHNALKNHYCGALPYKPYLIQYLDAFRTGDFDLTTEKVNGKHSLIPISAGPYQVVNNAQNLEVIRVGSGMLSFERNRHYWSEIAKLTSIGNAASWPGPDKWNIHFTLEEQKAFSLTNQGVAFAGPLSAAPLISTFAARHNFASGIPVGIDALAFHQVGEGCQSRYSQMRNFRQAVSLAINREQIVRSFYKLGESIGVLSIYDIGIDLDHTAFDGDDFMPPLRDNHTIGVLALRKFGYQLALCRFRIAVPENSRLIFIASELSRQMHQAGLKMEFVRLNRDDYNNLLYQGVDWKDYHGILFSTMFASDDPVNSGLFSIGSPYRIWNSGRTYNDWELKIHSLTAELSEARTLVDRIRAFSKRAIILRRESPIIPISTNNSIVYTEKPLSFNTTSRLKDKRYFPWHTVVPRGIRVLSNR